MKKILFVMSRDYDKEPGSGRKKIITNYLKYYNKNYYVEKVNLITVFDSIKLFKIQHLFDLIYNIIKYPNYPLQSIIYINKLNKNTLISKYNSFKPDVIFVDGIRITVIVNNLKLKCSHILDIDDLLSRRYKFYLNNSIKMSFGIYGRRLSFFTNLVSNKIKKFILKREADLISIIENEATSKFQKIIFSSKKEMLLFKKLNNIGKFPQLFHQIFPLNRSTKLTKENNKGGVNFLFIGSDMVHQNSYTLKFLINIWNTYNIKNKLYIIGNIIGSYKEHSNVIFLGYVDNLDEYYFKMDALLSPSFIEGGVKTKVLEAARYNVPTVGNKITFEGLDILPNYPFIIKEEDYPDFLSLDRKEFRVKQKIAVESVKNLLNIHNKYNHELLLEKLIK